MILPLSLALLGGLASPDAAPRVVAPLDGLRPIEARANTFTYGSQEDPGLAVDSQGRMLVVWTSQRQEAGNYGVFAQLLDPLGRPIGTELHVNESMAGAQTDPYVAFGPDDTAWAVWTSGLPGSQKNGVFLRRLAEDVDGFHAVGSEIRVGAADYDYFEDPAVAIDPSGALLVSWARMSTPDSRVIEAQRVAADGSLVGQLLALEPTDVLPRSVDLVALPSGGFFGVWARFDDLGRPLGIVGRSIGVDGTLGDMVGVSDGVDGRYHFEPSVDVDAAGHLLVAWMSADLEGHMGVFARRLGIDDKPFQVDAGRSGHKSGATAIYAPDGRFAVAYNDHSEKIDRGESQPPLSIVRVRAQLYDADGVALGTSQVLSGDDAGKREMQIGRNGRHAFWSRQGQLAVAWDGDNVGDMNGVGVSLWAPESLEAPAPPKVRAMPALAGLTPDQVEEAIVPPDLVPPGQRNLTTVPATFGTAAGTGFRAHTQTQFLPPDPDLGVGPDKIVTQVNGRIRIFDKAGTQLFDQDTNGGGGFWGSLGGQNFIFDPVTSYNTHSGRFFVMNSEMASNGDFFCFAASTSSSPSNGTNWNKYRLQVSPTCNFPDFPNLGWNQDAYFITSDCFNGGGNRAFIFNRTTVESGGTLTSIPSIQMSSGLQSLGDTKRYDTGTTQYFISAGFSNGSSLSIQAILNPTTTPTKATPFNLPVGSFSSPPDAPQLGTSATLDTIDNRIKHGVVRNDFLWCTHNVNVGGTCRVRWYQIALNGWPSSGSNPTLVQSGDINLGAGIFNWFGSIAVDSNDNMTIGYNRSASAERPSIEYVSRLATDPAGTVSAPNQLQISSAAYTGGRWGDYSGTVEDPGAPDTFWSHHEYSESSWSTWAGNWTVDTGGGNNPVADFSGTPLSGDAPLDVAFTDLSTGAGINSWNWSFGDGGSATVQNPSHTYVTPGTYTVSLTVTDTNGSDIEVKGGYITVTLDTSASVTKRCGSNTNPDVFDTVTQPVLGTTWTSTIDSGAAGGGSLTFVFGYSAPLQVPTVFGELLIDPNSSFFLQSIGIAVGGVATHNNPVPNDNALLGLPVFTQGFINSPGILTCALDLVLGT